MPFGLTNAPATFQSLMNTVFRPFLCKFVFSLMILFTIEQGRSILGTWSWSYRRCRENDSTPIPRNGRAQVDYLGHIISHEGVSADPSKVHAITSWPTPRSVRELCGFLGLTGYYRRFVEGYGVLARPLTDLLRKGAYQWTPLAEAAFQKLKALMADLPVLALPDFTKNSVLEIDAFGNGVGAVLMQESWPIAYFNKGSPPLPFGNPYMRGSCWPLFSRFKSGGTTS